MPTLMQNMEAFLEEEELRKSGFGGMYSVTDTSSPTMGSYEPVRFEDWQTEQDQFWQERQSITGNTGTPLDFVTHGLWGMADSAMFGALDWMDLDEFLWGGEYGEDVFADN